MAKLIDLHGGKGRIFSHVVDNADNLSRRGYWRFLFEQGMFKKYDIRECNFIEELSVRFLRKYGKNLILQRQVSERNYYDWHTKQILFLEGYFDEKQYFAKEINLSILHQSQQIKKFSRLINIHIRLTDYVGIDEFQPNVIYYERAILKSEVGKNDLVRVFSDDIKEAKSMLAQASKKIKFEFPEELKSLNAYELLRELSNSDMLICSRSSLCWWAAVAVLQKGGKVITPWSDVKNLEGFIHISK